MITETKLTARFQFKSDAAAEETFEVVAFSGYEAISRLYRYEIDIKTANTDLLLDDILNAPAHFVTRLQETDFPVDGILASFEETRRSKKRVHYRAVLVPRLWWLSIYKTNQIYSDLQQGMKIDVIIDGLLATGGPDQSGLDYDLTAIEDHPDLLQRNYRCQFGESDFDFISRLIENEGIFYYFEHDGVAEKIVFVRDKTYAQIEALGGSDELVYDVAAQTGDNYSGINSWRCRKQQLPKNLRLKDYDPVFPSIPANSAEVPVDSMGTGTDYSYGEHVRDGIEAAYLAGIRGEENRCQKTRYYGESSVTRLHAGYCFNFSYESFPEKYLVLEVEHEGEHLDRYDQTPRKPKGRKPYYRNSFVALDASEQFRPARLTPKPRFFGSMTGFIHASQASGGIEIGAREDGDNIPTPEQAGRYLVHLPFDQSFDLKNNECGHGRITTAWIRMAQPSVGVNQGTSFPLKAGTEVLLTFINGDPDRPVITAALPNGDTPSLLMADNNTESIIQTTGPLVEKVGMSTASTPPDFSGLDATTPKEPNALKNVCPAAPVHDHVDEVTRAVYVDGHSKVETEGSYVIHAQTQYVGQNQQTSHSTSWDPDTYGDPWLKADGIGLQQTLGAIRFEMLDDRVIFDAGNRDMTIKCNHFDVDNISEINQTEGHDHAVHHGTAFEKFFGNSEEHFIGEKEETFCGTITGLTAAEISERQQAATDARNAAGAKMQTADTARATADDLRKKADASRQRADKAQSDYDDNPSDVDLERKNTAAQNVARADEDMADRAEKAAAQAEADADVKEAREKAAAVARGKLNSTTSDTDITETFYNSNVTETFNGGKTETHNGPLVSTHIGTATETWIGANKFEFNLGPQEAITVGHTIELFGGLKEELALANSFEFLLLGKQDIAIGLTLDVCLGWHSEINYSGGFYYENVAKFEKGPGEQKIDFVGGVLKMGEAADLEDGKGVKISKWQAFLRTGLYIYQ